MKKQGFTLIELLAVIVILAIIALIAIPMISKIIDKTEDSAVLRSAELYIDGVNQSIMRANLSNKIRPKECIIQEDGNLICDGEYEIKIEATGSKPTEGILVIEDRTVKSFTGMIIDIYELATDEEGKIIISNVLESDPDKEYVDRILKGADPQISTGLIPVIYSNDNWVVANTKKAWYNYRKQEWANAVILKSGIEKNVGDTIDVSTEVQGMFVWVPRYEYKIEGQYGIHTDKTSGTAELPGEIKINFISNEKTVATSGYRIHPAFIFGGKQLRGIWVGKFETSTDQSNTCYTSPNASNCNNANQTPYILPNVSSLRWQTTSNQYITAQKFNEYLDSSMDSHMLKNSEWASAAYLSQSKYGKYGNTNYVGADKQVMINNCRVYVTTDIYDSITGIGADEQNSSSSRNTCTTNTYETLKGQAASTTGNITGIYDMSGGKSELVMGGYNKMPADSGFTTSTWPTDKYYDSYTSEDILTACNSGVCYGHAFSETDGWYGDSITFLKVTPTNYKWCWLTRGGSASNQISAGVFDIGGNFTGAANDFATFRVSITES